MLRGSTIAALIAISFFSLQALDCAAALSAEPATMACCRSMPCNSAQNLPACCQKSETPRAPMNRPPQRASLAGPSLNARAVTPASAVALLESFPRDREATQHSPPPLYTLHSSLLI